MSAYVDQLFTCVAADLRARRVGARHGHRWCHLAADSPAELHAFAARLGLQRAWYQNGHYDLTPPKRRLAVARGAKEVRARDVARLARDVILRELRRSG